MCKKKRDVNIFSCLTDVSNFWLGIVKILPLFLCKNDIHRGTKAGSIGKIITFIKRTVHCKKYGSF